MLPSEPQIASPIEDQILWAIISGSLPTTSPDAAPLGTRHSELGTSSPHPPSDIPHPTSPPNPISLANHFHLPLSRVLDILANPLTRTRIAAAQELRDLDFHQREQRARDKALTALESILDTTEDPIEKRRAATAILGRRANRNPFGGAGGTATLHAASSLDADPDEDADETPPRAPLPRPAHPDWGRSARQTLVGLLTRLQDNHNPEPDSGLATLFYHKHDTKNGGIDDLQDDLDDYLEDPGEEANLTNFSCAILHNPEPTTPASSGSPHPSKLPPRGDIYIERVTLHWPTHHRSIQFHLINAGNAYNIFWKLHHIDIGPKQTAPDSS